MTPQVLIVDTGNVFSKGLKLYLQQDIACRSVTLATNRDEVKKDLQNDHFTHIFLNIFLEGDEAEIITHFVRDFHPSISIMGYSLQPPDSVRETLVELEISQYVCLAQPENEILESLRNFIAIHKNGKQRPVREKENNPFELLAPREKEILHLLLKGTGTKDIAESLNLKMNTISTIKNRIYEKTQAGNIRELLELAIYHSIHN